MKNGINLLLTIVIIFTLSSCTATKISTLKKDVDVELGEQSGYLLLSLNTDRNVFRFKIDGEKSLEIEGLDNYDDSSYFLAAVPAGTYYIKSLNTSYFSQYRFDDEQGLWSFEVKPNVISYVGELYMRQRGANRSFFELQNNSSIALEYLEHNYPNILASRNIEYYGPGEDEFFKVVRRSSAHLETGQPQ